MSQIKESALELIGGTPILKLNGYAKKAGIGDATILAKLEYLNPAGSVKDRVALAMIEDGERKGLLKEGRSLSSLPVEIPASAWRRLQRQRDIGQFLLCRIP